LFPSDNRRRKGEEKKKGTEDILEERGEKRVGPIGFFLLTLNYYYCYPKKKKRRRRKQKITLATFGEGGEVRAILSCLL